MRPCTREALALFRSVLECSPRKSVRVTLETIGRAPMKLTMYVEEHRPVEGLLELFEHGPAGATAAVLRLSAGAEGTPAPPAKEPEPLSDAKHTGKCVHVPAPYANYFVHYHQTGGARGEHRWQVGRYDNLGGRSFNLWNCPGSYTLEAALAFAQKCAEDSEKRYGTPKAPEQPVPPPYGATVDNSPDRGAMYRGWQVCGRDAVSGRFYMRVDVRGGGSYTVAWKRNSWVMNLKGTEFLLPDSSLDEALDRAKEMMR